MAIAITTKWFMFNKKVTELSQFQFQFSRSVVSDSATPWTTACQASLSITNSHTHIHWAYPYPYPLSQWCHPTISRSVVPFSSCPQSFPASGFFPMNGLFTSGRQSIAALSSVLPGNIQGWFPLGLTGLVSLLPKGHWRVFSSTTVQKCQFFSTQPSS